MPIKGLLMVVKSPVFWQCLIISAVLIAAYQKGVKDTEMAYLIAEHDLLVKTVEENNRLHEAISNLAAENITLKRKRQEQTQPIVKKVNDYVQHKSRDSPCFIELDAVGMLDNLCEASGSCDTTNTTLPALSEDGALRPSG